MKSDQQEYFEKLNALASTIKTSTYGYKTIRKQDNNALNKFNVLLNEKYDDLVAELTNIRNERLANIIVN